MPAGPPPGDVAPRSDGDAASHDARAEFTDMVCTLATGPDAAHRVFEAVYEELRGIARRVHRRRGASQTLDTTAIVHEAYLRLVDAERVPWADRARFLALAATAMRRIVIDNARRRAADKRGGGQARLDLDAVQLPADESAEALLALHDALQRMETLNARLARVVECRFFAGLSEIETAAALGVTERTVRRDWVKARGWLASVMEP